MVMSYSNVLAKLISNYFYSDPFPPARITAWKRRSMVYVSLIMQLSNRPNDSSYSGSNYSAVTGKSPVTRCNNVAKAWISTDLGGLMGTSGQRSRFTMPSLNCTTH